MTKQELQDIFEAPFHWDNWRKVMDFVFPEFKYALIQEEIPLDNANRKKYAKYIKQHGTAQLTDGERLVLYEVALDEKVRLNQNVKSVRKLISGEVFTGYQIGLGVFHNDDKSKWRFTLVIREFTPALTIADKKPESYTYVFGDGEKGRTAAERFHDLSKIENKKLKDLEEAFSVEKLSKKFFTQYKEVYQEFVDNIINNPSRLSLFVINNKEQQEKAARDFVKKMMGRIVFLYFLQKKGWMGCKTRWSDGQEHFMQQFFLSAPQDSSFYMTYLEPLFFDTLNAKRAASAEDCVINGVNFGKVPFLNGGLFEREDGHPMGLTIDWAIFNRFFEVLNNYNFTIIEDDPDFKEIAVDPEMLGHIFENLLEDNKDKGAFYTPKEIVQYMCQESLIEFLNTQLSKNIDNERLKDAIRNFVIKQDFVGLNDISQRADQYVLQALRDIKVCDPAIGSGAFPMGILHEIYRLVEYLQEDRDIFLDIWDKKIWDAARVKQDIIQNSIYGVDIEKGAVDIARLRFWLSIIIDEDEPKPLPNLDYKIMQGNSLLERFGPIDLKFDKSKYEKPIQKQANLFGEVQNPQISIAEAMAAKGFDLTRIEQEYFHTEDPARKEQIRKEITEFEKSFIKDEIKAKKDEVINDINVLSKKLINASYTSNTEKRSLEKQLKIAENDLIQISAVEEQSKKIKEGNKPYFLWNLYFMDVFEQGGFDVVIGNPPYIQMQKESGKLSKELAISGYKTFERTGDIYALFYELGFIRLRNSGVHTFITSSQWMKASYGESLRAYFSKYNPKKLVLLGPGAFETATVDTNVLIASKESFSGKLEAIVVKDIHDFNKLSSIVNIKMASISQKPWIVSSPIKQVIQDKIIKHSRALSKWDLKINFGVKTGYNEAFIIDKTKRDELVAQDPKNSEVVRPILKGREIQKYTTDGLDNFIVFIPWHFPLQENEDIVGASNTAEDSFKSDYPSLYSYLDSHKENLLKRNKAETGIRYEWYALQRCANTYHSEFSKEKIVWKRIGSILRFAFVPNETYCLDSTCIATGEKLKFLTGFLNSRLCKYQLMEAAPKTGMGDLIISVQALDPLLVYYPNEQEEQQIEEIVDQIIELKKQSKDTQDLENQIDVMVFKLYELTYEEVLVVSPNFWLSEDEYASFSLEGVGMRNAESYFYFFSFGSNLLIERIKARTPSVEVVQTFSLSGYRILFNKESNDGSTKTNIERTGNASDSALGIIHRIDMEEKRKLDEDEAGYHTEDQLVVLDNGDEITLNYYIANKDRITTGKPYDWYMDYVIMGAIQNEFPQAYIQQLLSVAVNVDREPETRGGYNKKLTEKIQVHKKRNPEVWKH